MALTEEEKKSRARKAKATRKANQKAREAMELKLRKANTTANNAKLKLKLFKEGFEAGQKSMLDAMRSNQ